MRGLRATNKAHQSFLVGQKFDAGVLLDSDKSGEDAKKKIGDLYLKQLAADQKFRVFMLKDAAGIKNNEASIEDIFPVEFYLSCVNDAYGVLIKPDDLPKDGSDQIVKRVETVLKERHGRSELDKKLFMRKMLIHFDGGIRLKICHLVQPHEQKCSSKR